MMDIQVEMETFLYIPSVSTEESTQKHMFMYTLASAATEAMVSESIHVSLILWFCIHRLHVILTIGVWARTSIKQVRLLASAQELRRHPKSQ